MMHERIVGYTAIPANGMTPYSGARAALNSNSSGTTITAGYNVSSISRTGSGDVTITFASSISSSPSLAASVVVGTATDGHYLSISAITATTVRIITQTDGGANTDIEYWLVVFRNYASA